jgi:hypothetical protein
MLLSHSITVILVSSNCSLASSDRVVPDESDGRRDGNEVVGEALRDNVGDDVEGSLGGQSRQTYPVGCSVGSKDG